MSVVAVIPVKKLANTKKRLSGVLSLQQRQKLTLTMLKDVLTVVKSSRVNKIVVIGSDQQVKEVAKKFDAIYLEEKIADLNCSLKQGIEWGILNSAKSVLILPADVPTVTSKEINEIITSGINPPFVIIAASHNMGTNALFQNPPNLISTQFGSNSYQKHQANALKKGISPIIYQSEGLALDIDLPEDLERLLETKSPTLTRKFLAEIKND